MRPAATAVLVFAGLCFLNSTAWSDELATTTPAVAEAAASPQTVRIPDLSGEWCGNWQSCTSGHKGPMRATFCRTCDGNYQVTFVGRFCMLIPFRYTTNLTVTGYTDGVVYMSGSQNLGPIFGTFSYNACANDCQFASGYSSRKDQGQFVLSRQ
jgi:hypothetical protein